MDQGGAQFGQPAGISLHTVLVVEDEELIRMAVAEYLRDCGFKVLEAGDAAEAIAILKAGVAIDLVFSDIQMRGVDGGLIIAKWVAEYRPILPVILTSGAVQTADLAEELCALGPIEKKPYDLTAISQRMRCAIAVSEPRSVAPAKLKPN